MRSSTRTHHMLLLALRLAVAPAAAITGSMPAFAVDNMNSQDAPDLTAVRARIKAADEAENILNAIGTPGEKDPEKPVQAQQKTVAQTASR